jgi:hypothetical protein
LFVKVNPWLADTTATWRAACTRTRKPLSTQLLPLIRKISPVPPLTSMRAPRGFVAVIVQTPVPVPQARAAMIVPGSM